MQETHTGHTFGDFTTKVLTIIGFIATIALLIWLIVFGIKQGPSAFSSLASIAESIDSYRPLTELSITMEKTVVNSGESFQIAWTDMKKKGAYHFSYGCTDGVSLLVRNADGVLIPMRCETPLTIPDTVHEIFIQVTSKALRFTDMPFTVSFTDAATTETVETNGKITVVNATVPTGEQPVVEETEPDPEPVKPTPEVKPKPVVNSMYPPSDPNGYADLQVKVLGSGVLTNGLFSYTQAYDRDLRNALRFDIKNIGTKNSGTWTFTTLLPNGQVYHSVRQIALNPQEHIEFTIGFDVLDADSPVTITTTTFSGADTNVANNSATVNVSVRD